MDPENKLDEFLTRYKIPLAIGLVGLVLLIGGLLSSGILIKTFIKSSKGAQSNQVNLVKVDVSGKVVNPGVYTLSSEARIEDAIKMAGGITEGADPAYLSKTINLAQKVTDGMKIYVPLASENSPVSPVGAVGQTELVNINSASLSELDGLPGVGPVSAQKIIDKRPYGGIEELLTKKAVSRSTFEKIKGLVGIY